MLFLNGAGVAVQLVAFKIIIGNYVSTQIYHSQGYIDGQVCFYRRSFADPVKPRQSTTGFMELLRGTNKATLVCQTAVNDRLRLPG